jgi:release factor glutamine methyltransferase
MHEATGHSASVDPANWTTRRLLDWIRAHLAKHGVDSPRVCAELLVTSVLRCDRMRLYMDPDRPASAEERAALRDLVARAARHEPVQYLVGEAWFFSRPFEVNSAVLIPRPATETLVEAALRWCREQPAGSRLRAVDVGTGSGCIATSLLAEMRPKERVSDRFEKVRMQRAAESASALAEESAAATAERAAESPEHALPEPEPTRLEMVAIDCSAEALAVAARNASRHAVHEAIDFRAGDVLLPVSGDGSFDLVCSNPPYISDAEWMKVAPNVRDHEPTIALRGGRDGLDVIRRLATQAAGCLRRGGAIFIEIQFDQAKAVAALLTEAGFVDVQVLRDHEGHERVATGVRG